MPQAIEFGGAKAQIRRRRHQGPMSPWRPQSRDDILVQSDFLLELKARLWGGAAALPSAEAVAVLLDQAVLERAVKLPRGLGATCGRRRTHAAGARTAATTLPRRRQDSAQGHQGRLATVRAELLPALSAGCAPRGAGRHIHKSPRLPLHPARRLQRDP
jgi:hypothetical protein